MSQFKEGRPVFDMSQRFARYGIGEFDGWIGPPGRVYGPVHNAV